MTVWLEFDFDVQAGPFSGKLERKGGCEMPDGSYGKAVKRGYVPGDEVEFGSASIPKLMKAKEDLCYLLNHGYHMKGASVFVGNHYLLSQRQRLALVRGVSAIESIQTRKAKETERLLPGGRVNIDGFNVIITLEVALSGSTLLKCMDGTVRDLAALRGTYRLIDKTDTAIRLIGKALEDMGAGEAVFYLDAPVSNSGRLKQRIIELLGSSSLKVQAEVIHNVDAVLETKDYVITADAIILDKCVSWVNLNRRIMEEAFAGYPYVDFMRPEPVC